MKAFHWILDLIFWQHTNLYFDLSVDCLFICMFVIELKVSNSLIKYLNSSLLTDIKDKQCPVTCYTIMLWACTCQAVRLVRGKLYTVTMVTTGNKQMWHINTVSWISKHKQWPTYYTELPVLSLHEINNKILIKINSSCSLQRWIDTVKYIFFSLLLRFLFVKFFADL